MPDTSTGPGFGLGFVLHQTPVVALAEAGLYLPRSQTLIVSDLHIEKGSALARRGLMLPPFDTAETLDRLKRLMDRLTPKTLIALGDSFHDVDAGARLAPSDKAALQALVTHIPTIWIEGNHDPAPPDWLAGLRCAQLVHDGLLFRHEPTGETAGEVAGHLHPCARVVGKRGASVRRRCFVTDGRSLIMPAFGAFTGGLNIADPAFAGLFKSKVQALVPSGKGARAKIHAISQARLSGFH
ncbi:ligase-associated DNA damage response endonuclease PdeM [Candidatus Phycosocius spiralis]|uniref:Metallophosphatase n=1 Tax=Candidatus Phycosocius spiralis TaxID=2815099 RepID=A0ABQ4PUQ4_9PROT|nr:ligase-associated DNA damage response endonuclease PdeM [Candidatus Phycosocius spiralis]GIU66742.1 metallophosphatase [Candidatus Phycosocius spiralis]